MVSLIVRDHAGEMLANELFETDGQADTWIREIEASRRFGRPERWTDKEDLAYFKEDERQAIACARTGSGDYLRTVYLFKSDYVITRKTI